MSEQFFTTKDEAFKFRRELTEHGYNYEKIKLITFRRPDGQYKYSVRWNPLDFHLF